MSWLDIFLASAKWTTAVWAGVVVSGLLAVAALAALGGLVAAVRWLGRWRLPSRLPLAPREQA